MDEIILKEILLKARKEVYTGNLGNTLTTFKGDGLDFNEIKEYEYGDDIRRINWNATAKSMSVKTNVFNEERELNILVAFMISGTINFGSIRLKQDVMAEVMTMLAFSAMKNDDRLSALFFSDKEERFFRPSRDLGAVEEMLRHALKSDPLGKQNDLSKLCDHINMTLKRRSLIFIVSDFYGEVDLSSISHKHEVHALIVRDRLEESPRMRGQFDLVDPSTLGSGEFILDKGVTKAYERLLEAHDTKLKAHFLEHTIANGKIYTDEDVFLRLTEILKG